MHYVDLVAYVEPSMHLWDDSYLVMVDDFFDVYLDSTCKYFVKNIYICFN